jgi:hypothetical protein
LDAEVDRILDEMHRAFPEFKRVNAAYADAHYTLGPDHPHTRCAERAFVRVCEADDARRRALDVISKERDEAAEPIRRELERLDRAIQPFIELLQAAKAAPPAPAEPKTSSKPKTSRVPKESANAVTTQSAKLTAPGVPAGECCAVSPKRALDRIAR